MMLIAGYVLITKENIIMEEKTRIFESIYKECAEHFSESEDEKYVVGLWSGSGYFLDCFGVTAMDGEDALDKVVAYLTKSDDKALCLDVDEVQKMMDEDTEDAPKDDIDGSEVAKVYYEEKNIDRIITYCEKDVIAVAQILLRFRRQELLIDEEIIYNYPRSI
jgi:hypothetical protein